MTDFVPQDQSIKLDASYVSGITTKHTEDEVKSWFMLFFHLLILSMSIKMFYRSMIFVLGDMIWTNYIGRQIYWDGALMLYWK